ncbi:MAG: ribonuclease P protein component [Kiritimatiellaeota bacterium]|nr:ribonuclease P protein component [Kiritimatiellota bacterium]
MLPSLRTQADFERVFAENRNIKGRLVSAWAGAGVCDTAITSERRLGMKVTKKTFRLATERNRAKRLIRESFRLLLPSLPPPPWDLIVIPRRAILAVKEPDVRRELSWACRKLRLNETPVHTPDTRV